MCKYFVSISRVDFFSQATHETHEREQNEYVQKIFNMYTAAGYNYETFPIQTHVEKITNQFRHIIKTTDRYINHTLQPIESTSTFDGILVSMDGSRQIVKTGDNMIIEPGATVLIGELYNNDVKRIYKPTRPKHVKVSMNLKQKISSPENIKTTQEGIRIAAPIIYNETTSNNTMV